MERSDKSTFQATPLPIEAFELNALFSQFPGGVVITEAPSGMTIYQNKAAENLFRRPPLRARNYESYIHGALHSNGSRYQPNEYPITRALAGEVVTQEEMLYRRGDGSLGYFLVNATPIRRSDGSIGKVLFTFSDISEWRKAEQALKENEQRLAFALSSADLALWTLDITTGNMMIDEKPVTLLGYRSGEIRPTFNAWLSLIHIDDKQNVLDRWYEYLEGKEEIYEASFRLRAAQGNWKWISLRGQVVERDKNGKPLKAAGALLDIDKVKHTEIALRESEKRFRSTFEQAAIGIATVLPSGRWLSVNHKISDILGYSPEDLVPNGNIKNVIHPSELKHFETSLNMLLHDEVGTFTIEQRYIRSDGNVIWATLTASSVCDEPGRVKYLVLIIEDKTAEKLSSQQLQEMQAQLRIATGIARLGFWEWFPASGEVYFSPEWKAQLGYTDDELPNRWEEWEAHIHPDDAIRVLRNFNTFLTDPPPDFSDEFRMRHKDDSYRWISVRGVPSFDDDGKLVKLVGTHLDITDQKVAQENIRQLAQHDALTGLPNRGLLYEFSEHLFAAARRSRTPLAVLFLDLDRFKAVNDNYGHKVGDGVLMEVARRLGQLVRAEDVVGRLGGDEFVAVLAKIRGKEDAAIVSEKALHSLRQIYSIDGTELRLSPSIGISLFPKDGEDIDCLIQKADIAMYHVKNSGCNNFRFYTPEMNYGSRRQTGLENRLRVGLERKEFDLHYQPVVNTRTNAVIGVEALLRWPRAGGGQITPAEFVPIAEMSGLIVPIGEWILWHACWQHRNWIQHGLPPMPLTLKVSPVQLRRKEFQHSVEHVISTTGVKPDHIEIEITENAVMKNFDNTADALHALKKLGIKVALDAFGMGYSNLSQLSRLPIDKLKIAQPFVRHLSTDKASLAVAEVIIALGRTLGIQVVAKGVESENDLNVLSQLQCHQLQGFYLGRPLPGCQFIEWYKQYSLH